MTKTMIEGERPEPTWFIPNDGIKRLFLGWYGNVPIYYVEDNAALAQPPEQQ